MATSTKRRPTKSKSKPKTRVTASSGSKVVDSLLSAFHDESSVTRPNLFEFQVADGLFNVYVDPYNTNLMRKLTPEQVASVRIGYFAANMTFKDMADIITSFGTKITPQSISDAVHGFTHAHVRVIDQSTGYAY